MQNSQKQQDPSSDTAFEFVLLESDVLRPFKEKAEKLNVPFDQLVNRYLADYGNKILQPRQQATFDPPRQQAAFDKPQKKPLSMPLKEPPQPPRPTPSGLPPKSKHPRLTRFLLSFRLTRQEKWQVVANVGPLIGLLLLFPFLRWITGT